MKPSAYNDPMGNDAGRERTPRHGRSLVRVTAVIPVYGREDVFATLGTLARAGVGRRFGR